LEAILIELVPADDGTEACRKFVSGHLLILTFSKHAHTQMYRYDYNCDNFNYELRNWHSPNWPRFSHKMQRNSECARVSWSYVQTEEWSLTHHTQDLNNEEGSLIEQRCSLFITGW